VSIRLGLPSSTKQWAVLLAGAALTVSAGIPLAQGVYSLSWPKQDGVITHSREKAGYRTMGVDIGYRYSAGGATQSGNRYRFQFVLKRDRMRGRDVQLIVGGHRPGDPVRVAVNPNDPTDSVLDPGPDFESVIPFGLGLFFLLLGLGQVGSEPAVKERKRPRRVAAKVLAVTGLAMVAFGTVILYRGIRSVAWPTAPGKILYSHARTTSPETLLWYEYFVNERRFTASNYRNGGNVTPFASVAVEAAKRYPEGRVVTVHYDPSDPGEALLEPGVWWGNFVLPALGLVVVAAAWVAKKFAAIRAKGL
jgi:hypothetical protein